MHESTHENSSDRHSAAICHHRNVTEHPRYAIDDPPGHYRCKDCGDTFPLIGDTDQWAPKPIAATTPNPGSDEAVARGCICAVMDNGRGRGYLGGMKNPETGETMFVVTVGCPLHSPEAKS